MFFIYMYICMCFVITRTHKIHQVGSKDPSAIEHPFDELGDEINGLRR